MSLIFQFSGINVTSFSILHTEATVSIDLKNVLRMVTSIPQKKRGNISERFPFLPAYAAHSPPPPKKIGPVEWNEGDSTLSVGIHKQNLCWKQTNIRAPFRGQNNL